MPRDLNRLTARLVNEGCQTLLQRLLAGPLEEKLDYGFTSLVHAKRVQSILYDWMFFYPEVKARTSLRLNIETGILSIMPRATKEKRGRKKLL